MDTGDGLARELVRAAGVGIGLAWVKGLVCHENRDLIGLGVGIWIGMGGAHVWDTGWQVCKECAGIAVGPG